MDAAQPTLTTERLLLRPFDLADAPAVQRLAGERTIADTRLAIPHPYPDGAAEEWIATHVPSYAAGTQAAFAITLRAGGALVGSIGLMISPVHARAELGYWIGVPYWRRGYATEAGRAVVRFGFEQVGLHRIQAHHFTRNPASGRVLEKLGMQLEGIRRHFVQKWEVFEDLAAYSILVSDDRNTMQP
jgi:RimJ/RimL family protein N-acetyltransferase